MHNHLCEQNLPFPINDELSAQVRLMNTLHCLQCGSIDAAKAATVFRAVSEAAYSLSPVSQRYVEPVSK